MNAADSSLAAFAAWDARAYLADYYSQLERDEELTLEFLVQEFSQIAPGATALEFGAGPALHHLLPLAPYVKEVHVADYLHANLAEIRRWLDRKPGAHDWRSFTRHVLACEGQAEPTELDIRRREALTRRRVTRLLACDAANPRPLGPRGSLDRARYDVVVSCYCAESATADKATWQRYMAHILGLVEPGGLFVTAALRKCSHYAVGRRSFPCAGIDEHDLAGVLVRAGFDASVTRIEVEHVPQHRPLGYESIVLASGRAPSRGCAAGNAP